MKKVYETPCFMEENFEVNEYCVGACGTTVDGEYLFECTYGNKVTGGIFLENNGTEGFQTSDKKLGLYHSCNETHKTKNASDFVPGYYVPLKNIKTDRWGNMTSYEYDYDNAQAVTVWTEKNNWGNINNWHAMDSVPREHWVEQKS